MKVQDYKLFILFYIALTDIVYHNAGISAFRTHEGVMNVFEDQNLFEALFDANIFRYQKKAGGLSE